MAGNYTSAVLREFINTSTPMWVYCQQTLQFLEVNEAAIEKYGCTRDEFLQMTIKQIRPAEEVAKLDLAIEQIDKEGKVDSGAWLHQNKAGKTFYMHVHGSPIQFEGKKARLITAFDTDAKIKALIANKELEADLLEHSTRIENILESITDGFFAVDNQLRFTYINSQCEKIFGISKFTLINKNIEEAFPEDKTDLVQQCNRALGRNEKINFSEYCEPLDAWFSITIYPTTDGVSVFFRDITSEKLLQNEINAERYNLSALINNTDDLIWSIDSNFNIISANENFLEITRLGDKRLQKGQSVFSNFFDANVIKQWKDNYSRALRGESYTLEVLSEEFNYLAIYYEVNFNPICNEEDEIIGVGCFAKNITKQKKHDLIIKHHKEVLNEAAPANNQPKVKKAGMIDIISQFDFENPRCNENHNLLEQLKSTAKQLETIMSQSINATFN
ncbi:PAS domain S-box protein [Fulvivirga sp. RKSG066]|uniref:PAS domain-containing protein n=1 Tax=Fulvivirga aurantia TaxID=2529383 RepID=UPI0012BBC259|nr:PAS domain-containing protein [Fulvivirga aurantia]MTI22585.1 PAS domain S-box protein [Fulvivirga aurantia]